MDGFFKRLAAKSRFYLGLLTSGLLIVPCIGFGQSAAFSGSQSAVSTYPFTILDQHRVHFGQHSVTYNRVAPPVFQKQAPAPVIPFPAPAYEYNQLLIFSATVYDHRLAVLKWLDGNNGLVVVSNIDFNDFTTVDGFIAGDTFYEVIISLWNDQAADADAVTAGWLAQARAALPGPAPGYIVVSGSASAEDTQALDTIHAYYGANSSALTQAFARQQARYAALLLQLKLHPPVRPDTVINYWPIKSSVYLKGSGQ